MLVVCYYPVILRGIVSRQRVGRCGGCDIPDLGDSLNFLRDINPSIKNITARTHSVVVAVLQGFQWLVLFTNLS
jgi:hypothetical protein